MENENTAKTTAAKLKRKKCPKDDRDGYLFGCNVFCFDFIKNVVNCWAFKIPHDC